MCTRTVFILGSRGLTRGTSIVTHVSTPALIPSWLTRLANAGVDTGVVARASASRNERATTADASRMLSRWYAGSVVLSSIQRPAMRGTTSDLTFRRVLDIGSLLTSVEVGPVASS